MTENMSTINIPGYPVSEMVSILSNLYATAIKTGTSIGGFPTPFLWGPPGVGKSQGIHQMGDRISELTGKKVKITDIRLLLFSPIDLRGVPVADATRTFTDWLKPRIFDMDNSADTVNIILLDELSAAPQSIQAAAYQICLDKRIGEHTLPDNCIVVAAGNRTTDQSVSYKMPKALANRLMHMNITADYVSWRKWALNNDIDKRIIAYLDYDNSKFCVEPSSSDLAYPTPRSWEFVSNIIKSAAKDKELKPVLHLIAGCVGLDTAIELSEFTENVLKLPNINRIKKGKSTMYPQDANVLYALVNILSKIVREEFETLTNMEIGNICDYVSNIPKDYIAVFCKEVGSIKDSQSRFMKIWEYQKLLRII